MQPCQQTALTPPKTNVIASNPLPYIFWNMTRDDEAISCNIQSKDLPSQKTRWTYPPQGCTAAHLNVNTTNAPRLMRS